jgi:tetratricopeptide (TPR) repeat protein
LEERYDEASACYAKAAQANAKFSTAYFCQAYSLALAGRMEEARVSVERGLELQPGFQFRVNFQWRIAPPMLEQLTKGARLLGLTD